MLMNKKKSQSILDFIFTFVGILILVIGITRIMVWFNANYAARDVAYQQTRLQAGAPTVQDAKTDLVSVVPFRPLELTEDWIFKGDIGQQLTPWKGEGGADGNFSPTQCADDCAGDAACFDEDGKFNRTCPCYAKCVCRGRVQPTVNALTIQVRQYCGVSENCAGYQRNDAGCMACNFWNNGNSMWRTASRCDDPWEICWWGNWGKTASELKKAARKLWELAQDIANQGEKIKQKRNGMASCCNQPTFADQQRCFCNVKEEVPQKQLECRCGTYRSVAEQAQCMCGDIVDAALRQVCINSINKKIYSLTPFVPEEQCQQTCSGQVGCGVYPNNFNTNCQCFGQCVCGAQASTLLDGAISSYCGDDLNCNKAQIDDDCKVCSNLVWSCIGCFDPDAGFCNPAACNNYVAHCQKCGSLAYGDKAKCLNCAAENSGMACEFCSEGKAEELTVENSCAKPWRTAHPKLGCKELVLGWGRYKWCQIWFQDFWGDGWWCLGESSPVFGTQEECNQWCDWQWLYKPCPPGDPFYVGAQMMLGYLLSYKNANMIEEAGQKLVTRKQQYRNCCLKPTLAERSACIKALGPL